MKVLHVTNLYPHKEAPTYGIFVKEQIDSLKDEDLQDVFFINAKRSGLMEYYRATSELKKMVKKYDIIHCHHQFSTIPVYFSFPKANIITAILGDIKKRSLINKLFYFFAKIVSKKIILKNEVPDVHGKYIRLPNGVNLNFFKEEDPLLAKRKLGLREDQIHVLFVSNGALSNPIKRHDKFITIVEALNESTTGKHMFSPLYLSNIKREYVASYYHAADFMIMTSDHEGSPNAIKEAMACNLPIVSTPVGDVPTLLEGVSNSFVSDTGTVNDLVALSGKVNYAIGSSGRDRLIELGLDDESVAHQLKDVYNEVFNQ